ncbi:hypothetical protein ABK040_003855 [Willaertia magna]
MNSSKYVNFLFSNNCSFQQLPLIEQVKEIFLKGKEIAINNGCWRKHLKDLYNNSKLENGNLYINVGKLITKQESLEINEEE